MDHAHHWRATTKVFALVCECGLVYHECLLAEIDTLKAALTASMPSVTPLITPTEDTNLLRAELQQAQLATVTMREELDAARRESEKLRAELDEANRMRATQATQAEGAGTISSLPSDV